MDDFAGLELDFDTVDTQLAEDSCATMTSSDISTSTTESSTGWTPSRSARHGGGRPTDGYESGYVGVTSVLELISGSPDGLMYWAAKLAVEGKNWKEERDNARQFGTDVHQAVLDWLVAGQDDDGPPWVQKEERLYESLENRYPGAGGHALNEYLRWERRTQPVVEVVELPLRSERIGLAGTLDMPCTIGAVPVLVDLKTSSKIDRVKHTIQCAAYDVLWRDAYGEGFAEYRVLRLPKRGPASGGFEVFRYTDTARARDVFMSLLELYHKLRDFKSTTKGRQR